MALAAALRFSAKAQKSRPLGTSRAVYWMMGRANLRMSSRAPAGSPPSRPASSNRLFSIKHFSLAREYDVTGLFHSLCFLAIFLRNQYTQVS